MGTHTLSTYHSGGITLTNAGSYLSPFTITQTGTVVTEYPSSGVYSAITNPSLLNEGTIDAGGDGVQFTEGGVVTNSGRDATISGWPDGIYIKGSSGTVFNQGTITQTGGFAGAGVFLHLGGAVTNSTTASILASGFGFGVYVYGAAGTVTNQGTISAANNKGVLLESGGIVTNSSTASAIVGYGCGVDVQNESGTVLNAGTISAAGFQAGDYSVGIVLDAGGYVANNGTSAQIYGLRDGVDVYGSLGTVVNSGTIAAGGEGVILRSGVYLSDGGYVTNSGTGALMSGGLLGYGVLIKGLAGTVLNDGTISGDRSGVSLFEGSLVSNIGTSSVITGGEYGVFVTLSGTVINAGTISGSSTAIGTGTGLGMGVFLGGGYVMNNGPASEIFGGGLGVYIASSPGTVVNDGTISAIQNEGVYLKGGGLLANTDTSAVVQGGSDGVMSGVDSDTLSSTVVNDGSIFGASGHGVELLAGGSVTNDGTAAAITGY